MQAQGECMAYLSGLILRAEREQIGSAQKAMIEHAMTWPDPAARATALDDLLSVLTAWRQATFLSPLQDAFATVTMGMLERTRLMVGPQVAEA